MTDTISLRGLGRLMGVSEKAVRKALTAGVFSDAAVRRDASGTPEVINATLAVQEWERAGRKLRGSARKPAPPAPLLPPPAPPVADVPPATDPNAEIAAMLARVRELRQGLVPTEDLPPSPITETSPTLVKAQMEVALERGRSLRMENDLREGMLVEANQAAREAFEFARTLRENLLNIPARLSAELAAEHDAGRVHRRLEDALRAALESTAAAMEAGANAATVEG